MLGTELKPGDQVVYKDKDYIRWGPWKVLTVSDHEAMVVIEDRVTYSVQISLLEKVTLA